MKSILSIVITLFCINASIAQKVKVKKDKVLVDGTEVAMIVALDKKEIKYVIKDLAGEELFEVDVDIAEGSTRPFEFNWMTISSQSYPQVNVVDYSMLSMSLSHPKIIAEILTKTYGMFTQDGVDSNKIAEFFDAARTSKFKEDATGSGAADMANLDDGFNGKVRVKKDQVLFDKEAVAKVKVNDGVYTFSSLDGKNTFKVDFFVAELAGKGETLKWLAVSDKKRKSEIKMEYLSGNTSDVNALAKLLAEKYNIITANGIENLDEFFGVARKNLTEEYRVIFNEAKEAYLKAERSITFKIEEEDLKRKSIISDIEIGLISSKEGEKRLGTVETLKGVNFNAPNFYVNVIDKSNDLVAKITAMPDAEKKEFFLVGYDNKRHTINIDGDTQFSKSTFYRSLAKILVENGYGNAVEFGVVRAKEMAIEEYYAKSAEAGNLLAASGYMLTSKREKRNGLITLYFKYIPIPDGVKDNEENTTLARVDGNKTGKQFRFQSALGTDGSTYKARDNRGFCVYLDGGGEKCYVGKKLGTADYGFVETDALVPGN